MRLIAPLVLLAVVACAGANSDITTVSSAGPNIDSGTASGTSFDRYRTFSIGPADTPPAGYQSSAGEPQLHRRVEPYVAAALKRRGYVQVPEGGDLIVTFGIGRRAVILHEVSNISPGGHVADDTEDYVESALAINAVDRRTSVHVWHAVASARLATEGDGESGLARFADELTAKLPTAKRMEPAWPTAP